MWAAGEHRSWRSDPARFCAGNNPSSMNGRTYRNKAALAAEALFSGEVEHVTRRCSNLTVSSQEAMEAWIHSQTRNLSKLRLLPVRTPSKTRGYGSRLRGGPSRYTMTLKLAAIWATLGDQSCQESLTFTKSRSKMSPKVKHSLRSLSAIGSHTPISAAAEGAALPAVFRSWTDFPMSRR
jgi:hypothetical protein